MIRVEFDKSNAERFLESINNAKPLVAPGGAWTAELMLALAGALHFSVLNLGPHNDAEQAVDPETLTDEQRAAADEQLFADLRAAIEWNSNATMQVVDELYDYAYEPTHAALITGGNEPSIQPIRGFKDESGG